jgi:hypothetical protein
LIALCQIEIGNPSPDIEEGILFRAWVIENKIIGPGAALVNVIVWATIEPVRAISAEQNVVTGSCTQIVIAIVSIEQIDAIECKDVVVSFAAEDYISAIAAQDGVVSRAR